MSLFPQAELNQIVATHGYWAVGLAIGLESMGIPLPGETMLVLAAIYCAANADLNITLVICAAATGAILGDNLGYFIGQRYGYPLLERHGEKVGITKGRMLLGQHLFERHGGKVVFFGRFVALLRILAAFLAGVNKMDWRTFLIANAAGGIVWACVFGIGGYYFGKLILELHATIAVGAVIAAAIAFFGAGYVLRRMEHRMAEDMEREAAQQKAKKG